MENALALTIMAFEKVKPTSKKKLETLALSFEQIESLLKQYMKENHIPYIKVSLKTREALIVEPIPNAVKQAWVEEWLNGELSTDKFEKWLSSKWQNSRYLNFADFLKEVQFWLERKGKGKVACHG